MTRRYGWRGAIFVALFGVVASACGSSGGSSSATSAPKSHPKSSSTSGLRTGWIYDGSVADKGYDEEWYQGQQQLHKHLGIKAQYVQNEPYTSQWTSTDVSMATAGAKMLFDPGDGGSLFYAACKKLPQVGCVESNGVKPFPSNVVSVYPENWLASYVEGYAAGMLTKTGIIGFLEAFPNTPAPVMETLNALVLGCQASHPGCRAIATVVNSWYNPPVETEDLNALADAGADVLASTNNDPAAIEVAQKRGLWGIGSWANGVASGPNAFITSQIIDWYPSLAKLTKQFAAHKFPGGTIQVFGFGPGMKLAPWGARIPAKVRNAADAIYNHMKAGKNYFCGPIYDTTGKLRVPKGKCMSTLQIYDQWNWFVRGISVGK
jgi:basic membrane protein A